MNAFRVNPLNGTITDFPMVTVKMGAIGWLCTLNDFGKTMVRNSANGTIGILPYRLISWQEIWDKIFNTCTIAIQMHILSIVASLLHAFPKYLFSGKEQVFFFQIHQISKQKQWKDWTRNISNSLRILNKAFLLILYAYL
jgi:hypothetical protein